MNRFSGYQTEDGLYILDQVTGEVTFIGKDNKTILVRPAVAGVPAGGDVSLPDLFSDSNSTVANLDSDPPQDISVPDEDIEYPAMYPEKLERDLKISPIRV